MEALGLIYSFYFSFISDVFALNVPLPIDLTYGQLTVGVFALSVCIRVLTRLFNADAGGDAK